MNELLGVPVRARRVLSGGDIGEVCACTLADGRTVVVKQQPGAAPEALAAMLAYEADGLRWLAEVDGGAPVPAVLEQRPDLLVLEYVPPGHPTRASARAFGQALAATHRAGAPSFGADRDGFLAGLPLPNPAEQSWPVFYGQARLLPFAELAAARGGLSTPDLAAVTRLVELLPDRPDLTGPPEAPARLHGDLWSGNVLWDAGARGWLIDPAAHGGHRETDLGMLALFGTPLLADILAGYTHVQPLAEGWQRRVGLHQLHPLLVHAALFGGGYGARAGQVVRGLLQV